MANKGKAKVKRKRKLFKWASTISKYFVVASFTKEKSKVSDFERRRKHDPFMRKHAEFYAATLSK